MELCRFALIPNITHFSHSAEQLLNYLLVHQIVVAGVFVHSRQNIFAKTQMLQFEICILTGGTIRLGWNNEKSVHLIFAPDDWLRELAATSWFPRGWEGNNPNLWISILDHEVIGQVTWLETNCLQVIEAWRGLTAITLRQIGEGLQIITVWLINTDRL